MTSSWVSPSSHPASANPQTTIKITYLMYFPPCRLGPAFKTCTPYLARTVRPATPPTGSGPGYRWGCTSLPRSPNSYRCRRPRPHRSTPSSRHLSHGVERDGQIQRCLRQPAPSLVPQLPALHQPLPRKIEVLQATGELSRH